MAKEYVQGNLFVLELDENDWYLVDDDAREGWRQAAEEQAVLRECTVMAIMVIPDALFSMCDKNTKHRVYEKHVVAPAEAMYSVDVMYTGTIDEARFKNASEGDQRKAVRQCRDALNVRADGKPGRYVILVGRLVIEQGRV